MQKSLKLFLMKTVRKILKKGSSEIECADRNSYLLGSDTGVKA